MFDSKNYILMFKNKSICNQVKPVLYRINNSENIFCHIVFEDYLDVSTVQFYEATNTMHTAH